jgi:hypothetical protein
LSTRDMRVYVGTCFPYPGSIGCEKAASPARSMLFQVFTGSPFVDTGSMLRRRLQ